MDINNAKTRTVETIAQPVKNKLRTSIYTEDYRGEYYNIPVEKLVPFRNQARRYFDPQSIEALSVTIKEHGIRQPLTVMPSDDDDGQYEIVSGERRYKAALLVGLRVVPCIILHDRKKAEEIAIIENVQREDLHPIELMRAYLSLLQHGICSSMQEVADKLGVAKSAVVETINLKNLDETVCELLLSNKISNRDFLRILCKLDMAEQKKALSNYLNERKIIDKEKIASKKVRILSVMYSDGNLSFDCNKSTRLTSEQTHSLKAMLTDFIQKL